MSNEKNKPWIEHPHIWSSQPAFFSYVRNGLRRSLWMRNPIKLEFLNRERRRLPLGRDGRVVWGFECEICEEYFKTNDIEVNHIHQAGQLKSEDDVKDFVVNLCFVSMDDLQILCKPCHKIVTHSERYGMTFEEASLDKQRVLFFKLSVEKQKSLLMKAGAEESLLSNAQKRKEAFKKYKPSMD